METDSEGHITALRVVHFREKNPLSFRKEISTYRGREKSECQKPLTITLKTEVRAKWCLSPFRHSCSQNLISPSSAPGQRLKEAFHHDEGSQVQRKGHWCVLETKDPMKGSGLGTCKKNTAGGSLEDIYSRRD